VRSEGDRGRVPGSLKHERGEGELLDRILIET
jgi:hypothetical protein